MRGECENQEEEEGEEEGEDQERRADAADDLRHHEKQLRQYRWHHTSFPRQGGRVETPLLSSWDEGW